MNNGSDAYFLIVGSYIHLNPARAGLFDLKMDVLSILKESITHLVE